MNSRRNHVERDLMFSSIGIPLSLLPEMTWSAGLKGAWDRDGRIRCQYKFTTISGRLASSKNPRGKGYNLQNPDREIRDTFLPDEGKVFVKIDMSQIEDRKNVMI